MVRLQISTQADNAFTASGVIKGKKVILVDDVMTTGSTVDLCAATLKKAGAKEVVVVCVARTLI